MDVKLNVLAAVAPSLSVAACTPTVIAEQPKIMAAKQMTGIGPSWQPEGYRAPLREEPAPSEERHRSCACAHERAPLSAGRRHVLKSPGGLLVSGEPGGTGTLVRRRRHPSQASALLGRACAARPEHGRDDRGGLPHCAGGVHWQRATLPGVS